MHGESKAYGKPIQTRMVSLFYAISTQFIIIKKGCLFPLTKDPLIKKYSFIKYIRLCCLP